MPASNTAHPESPRLLGALLGIAAIAACGSDTSSREPGPARLDATSESGPLHALGVRVVTADSRVGDLLTVPSIEEGAVWSFDRASEVVQDAWLTGTEGELDVLQSSSLDSTIQKWHVETDGALTPGPVLSFTNLGLQRSRESQGSTSPFLRDKAYFLSRGNSSCGHRATWPSSAHDLRRRPHDARGRATRGRPRHGRR